MTARVLTLLLLFFLTSSLLTRTALAQWCTSGTPTSGVNTALGCLHTDDLNAFVTDLLRWGVGLSAGAAFLAIAFAGFTMITAGGDPKRVKAGQELITAAISGIALIVLSVVILNFVGIKILDLSGLGF